MPNPFGVIKKFPKKLISAGIRLMKLDRILLEVFVAAISVPDEKLEYFFEVKLRQLAERAEKPLQEIAEKFGEKVLRPIFQAIPGMNLLYIVNDIQKAQEAVAEAQLPVANVLRDIIREARELTSDVAGPARGLSSLILGLSEYLEKVKNGGNVKDVYHIFDEMGRDVNGTPTEDNKKRAAARLLASDMIHDISTDMKKAEKEGFPVDAKELLKKYKKKLSPLISKETDDYLFGEGEKGLFDILMDHGDRDDGEVVQRVKISRPETQTQSITSAQSGGTRKNRMNIRLKNKTRKNK
jgi:hypothetical protein